jgi:hypothetical protein
MDYPVFVHNSLQEIPTAGRSAKIAVFGDLVSYARGDESAVIVLRVPDA